ncbi:hypothetical protein [Gelidibacter pelagius]|uniref:Cthe-2314-like HEPN domain-containing protein n=1 Tax=Gelidibacter pelagius TaxID=2819985 RepID=A0ABS3SWH1_9FLAO|nr:hypothetical protein [Gelidibacter pelagius]MBO3100064.1 hypothetical protein [Gelidibacter pelagius]
MQEDLFGNSVDNRDSFEKELYEFDKATFDERLRRLRYFYKYFPEYNNIMFGSDESYRIFKEVQSCFINAEDISVVILALSFIERRFQELLHIKGFEAESKDTLNNILKNFKGKSAIPDYFLDKVNELRLKRNPFVHLRNVMDKDNLFSRSILKNKNTESILKKDAKDAISLMFESLKIKIL